MCVIGKRVSAMKEDVSGSRHRKRPGVIALYSAFFMKKLSVEIIHLLRWSFVTTLRKASATPGELSITCCSPSSVEFISSRGVGGRLLIEARSVAGAR